MLNPIKTQIASQKAELLLDIFENYDGEERQRMFDRLGLNEWGLTIKKFAQYVPDEIFEIE